MWNKKLPGLARFGIGMVLILLFAGAVAGCGNGGTGGKNPNPADITTAVMKQIKFPEMVGVGQDRLTKYYQVPQDDLASMSVYLCSSLASADEVAVFKAKDQNGVSAIKEALEKRVAERMTAFQNYNPTEYAKVKNNVIAVKGDYVFFDISADPTKAREIFNSFF